MVLNFSNTKEIVFRQRTPKLFFTQVLFPRAQIEPVKVAKLLVLLCLKDYILMIIFLLS